jgi:hypothetical protein
VSENEQLRESYAVFPSELQDLPDLRGCFKIAGLPAAKVRVKVKKFPKIAQRFMASSNKQDETIDQQWQRFIP